MRRTRLVLLVAALLLAVAAGGAQAARPGGATYRKDPVGVVVRHGAALYLNGAPYRFTGVNAYELSTLWSVNWGCGTQVDDLNGFFAGLRPHSMVRVWAYQALGYNNKTTHAIDFTALDRLVAAAERAGQLLVLTMSDQSGTCDDGHWHDQAWYDGGYRTVHPDDGRGLTPLSYWDWVHQVVPRYAASPALGMWELVNEAEASSCQPGYGGAGCYGHLTCPAGAAASLRGFFDTVGGEVKRLDPRHLIASGVIGGGQCGMAGGDYGTIHASTAVDVATFHDYGNDTVALPGEVAQRITDAAAVGKPLVVEETGIDAGYGAGCPQTPQSRATLFGDKLRAALAAGAVGYLPWVWSPDGADCDLMIPPGDPTLALLHDQPL